MWSIDIQRPQSQRGFTIIELLVSIVILSILATAAAPMAEHVIQRNREQELRRALLDLREGIDAYKQASDEGRIIKVAGASGYPPNLEVLAQGVPDARDPKHGKIYFMRKIPRDPLFPDAAVKPSQTWGKRSYASDADHPVEGADVFDVYSLAAGAGLNGTPYREW